MWKGFTLSGQKEWYSISAAALKGWITLSVLVVLAVVGSFGWRYWESHAVSKAAAETLEEARYLVGAVQKEQDLSAFREQYDDAWNTYGRARDLFANDRMAESLENSRRSVALLSSIRDALKDQGSVGEAHFISVAGRVEFRRGEHGDWEEARSRVTLREGYYVRTGDGGSTEIMFVDGTLYHVRPGTLFLVSRPRTVAGTPGGRGIQMRYGWLDLSTTNAANRVSTPGADAEVRQDSSATVTYEEDTRSGRIAAYQGAVQISSGSGLTRQLKALQEVAQRGDLLSEPRSIPRTPQIIGPRDNVEVGVDPDRRLVLSWQPVSGASRYELQVSRNNHFVDNVVESADRQETRATLGVLGEGAFLWRVRAINANGSPGEWSEARKFRASQSTPGVEGDADPPELSVLPVQTYGSIFIISGTTEPGASVLVRGEPAQVGADGSFTKTLQVYEEGWTFLDVRAKDPYGNETVRPVRVYVDSL